MSIEKFKNLFLILIVILIVISIPYLIYSLGTLVEIDYFGYINNWWIVLLFVIVLISIFVLAGINFEKKMGLFFLTLFTVSFFILGMRIGVQPNLDMESYALLLNKEQEINQLDSIQLVLENDFEQLEDDWMAEHAPHGPEFKTHEIIFFDAGSAKLSDYNQLRVTAFISILENCKLNVNGYSDNSGDSSSNMDISTERAQNVADFIQSMNQQNNTINKVTGFGANKQLVHNSNEITRSKNRRVTIEIVGKTDGDATAQRKKIQDEMDKNRADIKNVKLERDSLMDVIFKNVEE
jgi:outer membrane protein OmpA-like peptidoglycan-associated protein